MLLIRVCSLALLSLLILVTSAYAQVVGSSISIDSAKVVAVPPNSYKITETGKATLGTNDTFQGVQHFYILPKGGTQTPFLHFPIPSPGKTVDWNSYSYTTTTGQWNSTITMAYKDANGLPGDVAANKTFNVP